MDIADLDLRTETICINFQFPINIKLQEKFEENWLRDFRGEVVQNCGRTTDGRTKSVDNSSFLAQVS